MKGLRWGEEKVQQVAIIVHCMLQRISKYSQKHAFTRSRKQFPKLLL
jgi:hypothetical protein